MQAKKEVVILGAGLAGLACARTLQAHRVPFQLLEASDRAGGRIRTDLDPRGFLLDRGFQVLLNSYPELPHFLDLQKLNLQSFGSGAKIFSGSELKLIANPARHPNLIFQALTTRIATGSDKMKVVKILARAFTSSAPAEKTTLQFLQDFGFSQRFIECFWRPFFAGVYLDSELSTSAEFFMFLLKCFSVGAVTVPELGMEAIPKQMTSSLRNIRFHASSIAAELQSPGRIVVQAFNLNPEPASSASTYYFSSDVPVDFGKWLILVPGHLKMKINHMVCLSSVAESYAPPGQHLISATVVKGDESVHPSLIAREIEQIARKPLRLQHLRTDSIAGALPLYHPKAPHFLKRDFGFECGDHLSSPSSNGALKSGRLAAEAIIQSLSN